MLKNIVDSAYNSCSNYTEYRQFFNRLTNIEQNAILLNSMDYDIVEWLQHVSDEQYDNLLSILKIINTPSTRTFHDNLRITFNIDQLSQLYNSIRETMVHDIELYFNRIGE